MILTRTFSSKIRLSFLFLANHLLVSIMIGCQSTDTRESISIKPMGQLTIATAANMQFVISELVQTFSIQTGIACQTIISSSGKLAAQIQEGAPFDVFISADMKYPMALFDMGLTVNSPKIYAYGKLVIWGLFDQMKASEQILLHNDINHIAIANPQTSPYGLATIQALKNYQIYDQIKDKLVFGESIAQTNQFILSQAAEVGFTAKSVVLSNTLASQGQWAEVSTKVYEPIAQGVVVIDHKSRMTNMAEQFSDFLFSGKARAILEQFGYVVVNSSNSEK